MWYSDGGGDDDRFGICDSLGLRCGNSSITPGSDVDLHRWLLRGVVVLPRSKRAAARQVTDGRLCPTLTLNRNAGGAKVLLEFICAVVGMIGGACVRDAALAPCLSSEFVLCGAELTSGLGLLFERLLLLSVGISDLDLHFFAGGIDCEVVEVLDDIFARLTRLESAGCVSKTIVEEVVIRLPSKANTTTVTVLVSQDSRGAHLVWLEQVLELVFVHRFREVGDVEVGVALVGESLELRVERLL